MTTNKNFENDNPLESSLNPDITVSIDTEESDFDKDSVDYETDPTQPDTIDPDILNITTEGKNIGPTVSNPSESESLESNDEEDAEVIDPDKINIGTSNPNVGF